jgi:hypothetical protein
MLPLPVGPEPPVFPPWFEGGPPEPVPVVLPGPLVEEEEFPPLDVLPGTPGLGGVELLGGVVPPVGGTLPPLPAAPAGSHTDTLCAALPDGRYRRLQLQRFSATMHPVPLGHVVPSSVQTRDGSLAPSPTFAQ